jgi:hypothetical protein
MLTDYTKNMDHYKYAQKQNPSDGEVLRGKTKTDRIRNESFKRIRREIITMTWSCKEIERARIPKTASELRLQGKRPGDERAQNDSARYWKTSRR